MVRDYSLEVNTELDSTHDTIGLMPLVLVVDDENDIAEMLEIYLRQAGFRTERAADGKTALSLFRSAKPDLILLDVQIPGLDGIEVLRKVRAEDNTPVILVTARIEDIDKLLGLEMGADDYITKPFSAREVLARVKAVLRRTSQQTETREFLRVGTIEIDTRKMVAVAAGKRLNLTLTEYRLLATMLREPGRIYSRAELMEEAMPESDALERVVDVHLKNLRKKLEEAGAPEQLETVRGMGYRIWETA